MNRLTIILLCCVLFNSCKKEVKEEHLELVGIFHSHPKSIALPSNTDRKFMGLNGDVPWIIFSGLTTDFKAFILKEDVEEIKIRIMERHFSNKLQ